MVTRHLSFVFRQSQMTERHPVLVVATPPYLIRTPGLVLGLLLFFWSLSLWQLGQFPIIQNDEPSIVAPGYRLFRDGIYGSDLYVGFYNQEHLYLETMPLMPLLQGLSMQLFGVGVWPMRVFPVVLGTLTLALTYQLGQRLANSQVALFAVLLVLFWQWHPGDSIQLGTGIPLLDLTRIGRYDILVPPLGLSAMMVWLKGRHTGLFRYDFISGLLIGLAGLANIYGLFWLVALGVCLVLDGWLFTKRSVWPSLGLLTLGMLAVLSIWGIVVATHWADFIGQASKHDGRFDLFNPWFYLNNLFGEIHRYRLGLANPNSGLRIGLWLLLIGLPLSWVSLGQRIIFEHNQRAMWLVVSCLIFLLLFALLISKKKFAYLLVITPCLSISLAWGWYELLNSPHLKWRRVGIMLGILLISQGGWAIIRRPINTTPMQNPAQFFTVLNRSLPVDQVVMGPLHYWFAFPEGNYRDFGLAFISTVHNTNQTPSFEMTLEAIQPQIVLVTPTTNTWLQVSNDHHPLTPSYEEQFWHFMTQHQAQKLAELNDYNGDLVEVYQLSWP